MCKGGIRRNKSTYLLFFVKIEGVLKPGQSINQQFIFIIKYY